MRKTRAILLFGVVVTLVVGSIVVTRQISVRQVQAAGGGVCVNLYLQGGYGFAGQGFSSSGGNALVPIAISGGFIAVPNMAAGATNGTLIGGSETVSRQGRIQRLTFTGTFQASRSVCGGTVMISTSVRTTVHYDYMVNQWSTGIAQEGNFIQTDPGNTLELTLTHV